MFKEWAPAMDVKSWYQLIKGVQCSKDQVASQPFVDYDPFALGSHSICTPHPNNVNPSNGGYRLLLSLGSDLAGWQGLIHGGISTMIDEAMQELAFTEMQAVTATKQLTCSFERPLTLPGVVMARAWAEERPKSTTRKLWVKCQISDGDGNVFVCGRALFIKLKGRL